MEPSRTLNAEESVARGAALAAAMHSRGMRVKGLVVNEGLLHPLEISWSAEEGARILLYFRQHIECELFLLL